MELWFMYAVGAAVFAALTTILAKIGIKDVDSHLATAIRTMVVLAFAWIMVFIVGSQYGVLYIQGRTWVFLVLSGLATGGSWLCFFRALQLGNVNKVVPIDKSSTILTMILAFIFLSEPVGWVTAIGMILMGIGTWMMLELKATSINLISPPLRTYFPPCGFGGNLRNLWICGVSAKTTGRKICTQIRRKQVNRGCLKKNDGKTESKSWLMYALLAAVFASLVAIFGRIGVADMDANLWTAIRTMVVVPLSWLMVFVSGSHKKAKAVDPKSWVFLILSGVATGVSWLFFYHALQIGNASHVVPIDKLSIVLTMGFARLFLGERFSVRSVVGLGLLTFGTLLPIFVYS